MLELITPIPIGSYIYTHLKGGIKLEIDERIRRIEALISLAREQNGITIFGTREMDGDQGRILPPPIVATYTLIDSFPHDPAYALIFQKLHELSEAIEAVIVTNEYLKDKEYLVGEKEMSLDCTFTASAAPGQLEEKEKVKKPKD